MIASNGLPGRTERVLRRERARLPAYVDRLMGGGDGEVVKGEPEDDPADAPVPTIADIVAALHARDSTTLGVAAFLAGRCDTSNTDDGVALESALRELVTGSTVDDLGLLVEGYIEAALSLGVRGQPEAARRALLPLVQGRGDGSHDWLAASALAQLGDPVGWPALVRCLHDGNDHVRLMSARQLVVFGPYDGQVVAGETIDVERELRLLDEDESAWVRGEAADLLEEAGVDGAR